MSDAHAAAHDDGHNLEAVYPYTPHHFHEAKQHFESGKMGVWLFLVTEILFFAGLFCAYTVYRAQHPEIFYWAHFYLDTKLGALNTIVLILSSFTAAWAVRNAQLGQNSLLRMNVVLTIGGALVFMCVKYVEYSHKFHDGLLPSRHFNPTEEVWETHHFKEKHPESAAAAERIVLRLAERKARAGGKTAVIDTIEAPVSPNRIVPVSHHEGDGHAKKPVVLPAEDPKLAALPDDVWLETQIRSMSNAERRPLEMAGVIRRANEGPVRFARPDRAGIFFSIYFFMTGLHGVHVVIGIGLWVWMLVIAAKRKFGTKYFGPIEFTALYWHLVDLIWIYLFPMLYLIH
jgi:cytochrome c oxidase subunit III